MALSCQNQNCSNKFQKRGGKAGKCDDFRDLSRPVFNLSHYPGIILNPELHPIKIILDRHLLFIDLHPQKLNDDYLC